MKCELTKHKQNKKKQARSTETIIPLSLVKCQSHGCGLLPRIFGCPHWQQLSSSFACVKIDFQVCGTSYTTRSLLKSLPTLRLCNRCRTRFRSPFRIFPLSPSFNFFFSRLTREFLGMVWLCSEPVSSFCVVYFPIFSKFWQMFMKEITEMG